MLIRYHPERTWLSDVGGDKRLSSAKNPVTFGSAMVVIQINQGLTVPTMKLGSIPPTAMVRDFRHSTEMSKAGHELQSAMKQTLKATNCHCKLPHMMNFLPSACMGLATSGVVFICATTGWQCRRCRCAFPEAWAPTLPDSLS